SLSYAPALLLCLYISYRQTAFATDTFRLCTKPTWGMTICSSSSLANLSLKPLFSLPRISAQDLVKSISNSELELVLITVPIKRSNRSLTFSMHSSRLLYRNTSNHFLAPEEVRFPSFRFL